MNKGLFFSTLFIVTTLMLTVSCNRKVMFGKSPVSKVIDKMTLEEKVNLLTIADGSGKTYPIERLGIPSVILSECPSDFGVGMSDIMLAQSWNQDLIEEVGTVIGSQAKENGADCILFPSINIHNPVIYGHSVAAIVRGVQSNSLGAAIRVNDFDDNGSEIVVRESQPWIVSTSLYPQYVAGADSILRNEWVFDGSIMAGLSGDSTALFTDRITEAVRDGILDQSVIDRNVEKMLDLIARTSTIQITQEESNTDTHTGLSRTGLAESMVLLKNAGTLPLGKKCKMVALYGISSYDMYVKALRESGFKLEPSVYSAYSKYSKEQFIPESLVRRPFQFRADAIQSDVAVITIGRTRQTTTYSHHLTDAEKGLIKDVCDAFHSKNKKVVVVLGVGTSFETSSWKSLPDAILLAGLPAQETGSTAIDILKGKINPSGKLVDTYYDYALNGSSGYIKKVSYPLGHGLSYTSFKYSDPQVQVENDKISFTINVTNTGTVAGKEIVQVYLDAPKKRSQKYARELMSYAKTTLLQPGESQVLEFTVSDYELNSLYKRSARKRIQKGEYTAYFSASSQDVLSQITFTVSDN